MRGLPKHVMEYARALPEATPLCPGALLHLGHRAAIDQALSRLARSGELMRDLPGRLHASRRDPFRLAGAPSRQGSRRAVRTLGRNHRALRRRGRQPPRADHAESGPRGLPDLLAPTAVFTSDRPSWSCGTRRAGNSRPRTARPAMSSAHWHGSVRKRSRTGWKRSCRRFATRTARNSRPREPPCRTGWHKV